MTKSEWYDIMDVQTEIRRMISALHIISIRICRATSLRLLMTPVQRLQDIPMMLGASTRGMNVGAVPSYYLDVTPQFNFVMSKIMSMSSKIRGVAQSVD